MLKKKIWFYPLTLKTNDTRALLGEFRPNGFLRIYKGGQYQEANLLRRNNNFPKKKGMPNKWNALWGSPQSYVCNLLYYGPIIPNWRYLLK